MADAWVILECHEGQIVLTPRVLGDRLEVVADALKQAAQNTSASKHAYMERAQKRANAPPLQIGDRVITKAHERIPFDSKWDLPKEVTRIRGPVVWCRPIKGAGVIKSYNRNQLKKITDDADWRDVRPRVARRQRAQAFAPPVNDDVTARQPPAKRQNGTTPAVARTSPPDPQPSTSYATSPDNHSGTDTTPEPMVTDPDCPYKACSTWYINGYT